MSPGSSSRLLGLILFGGVAALWGFVQGPHQLGVRPPVYHDEGVALDATYGVFDRGVPSHSTLFNSRPRTEALGGAGRLDVVLQPGYYYSLAAWAAFAGESVSAARMFPGLSALAAALMLLLIGQRLTRSAWVGALAAVLFVLDGSVTVAARTVRPDVPTAAAYLSAAWVLLQFGTRTWGRALGGVLAGVALTMNPVGAVALPAVWIMLWFGRDPAERPLRVLAPFLFGVAPFAIAYAVFLGAKWPHVQTMLALHGMQRPMEEVGYVERLAAFWSGQYPNTYMQAMGTPYQVVLGIGLAAAPIVGALRRPGVLAAGLSAISAILLLPLLGRDYGNFVYLCGVLPWVYLAYSSVVAAAAGYLVGLRWKGRIAEVLAAAMVAASAVAATVAGIGAYTLDAGEFASNGATPFEATDAALTAHVERGSWIIGTPNALSMVRATDSAYVHNDLFVQWRPEYATYPVRVWRDGSHLRAFEFDREVLEKMSRTAPVYFHMDMFDWGWNAYSPHGGSVVQMRAGLEAGFHLVARAFAYPRGAVELWRFGSGGSAPAYYDEGRAVRLGEPVFTGTMHVSDFDTPTRQVDVATLDVRAGQRYWITAWIKSGGSAVAALCLDRVPLPKYFVAHEAIRMDSVNAPKTDRWTVSLFLIGGTGDVVLEIRPVEPLP